MSKPEQTVLPVVAWADSDGAVVRADSKLRHPVAFEMYSGALTPLAEAQAEIERLTAERDEGAEKVLVAFLEREAALADARRLRVALETAHKHLEMDAMRISHCKDAAVIDAALAATVETRA